MVRSVSVPRSPLEVVIEKERKKRFLILYCVPVCTVVVHGRCVVAVGVRGAVERKTRSEICKKCFCVRVCGEVK